MNNTIRTVAQRLVYVPRAIQLVWTAAKGWTLAWGILLIVQGLLPVATVFLTRLLIDTLVATINASGPEVNVRPALFLVGLMVAILVLAEILQSATEWIRTAQAELVKDHISTLIQNKSVSVDLAFYESADYHDHLYRAREEASYRPLELLESTGALMQDGLTLISMALILIPYGLWVPLLLLVSTLPALYVVLRFDWHYHQWWKQTTADRRWTDYYNWMLTDSLGAAEVRLFGLGPHFQSAFQSLRRRLRSERLRLMRGQSSARLGAGLAALLISGPAVAWMVWRTLQGVVTLGELTLFYQAFSRGQSLMRSLLGNMGKIYSNSLFLGNMYEFLGLTPTITDPVNPIPVPHVFTHSVSFRNVTFRYPGSERLALHNFNLTIPAGQIVAIVGANGAGKSTLLKLLCRFYDPEAGQIEIDGIDIRKLAVKDLQRLITVMFQSPVPYHATAGDNIGLGDLASAPQRQEIQAAARSAGADEIIARLPQQYDTLLGKWFANGVELSGGEWQRIALARAFLRHARIFILDEPTSAMDSWAEADWLDRFRVLANERTSIIITHRLTIAMRADIIHVMDNGHIVESGSHDELLFTGGRYAKSWAAQTQNSSQHY